MMLDRISGRMSDGVAVKNRYGTVIRQKPVYRPTPSTRQLATTQRLRQATAVWNELDITQAQAWDAYASTLTRTSPINGTQYSPSGFNAFIMLATKFLQANPSGTVPTSPPTTGFNPTSLQISVAGIAEGVLFLSELPSEGGVVVELTLQRLVNQRRKPGDKYQSMDFVAFTSGEMSHLVETEPGWYACAIRQVEAATGRMQNWVPLGVVNVG